MVDFSLTFPDDFKDYEWEITAKGYFDDLVLVAAGERYKIRFYDQARILQEIVSELDQVGFFHEPNVIVIQSVTKKNMERAVEAYLQLNQLSSLTIEKN